MERCDVCEYCGEYMYHYYPTMGKHDIEKCKYKDLIGKAWDAATFIHTNGLATTDEESEKMKKIFMKNNGIA